MTATVTYLGADRPPLKVDQVIASAYRKRLGLLLNSLAESIEKRRRYPLPSKSAA
jgi:hypothetical protein